MSQGAEPRRLHLNSTLAGRARHHFAALAAVIGALREALRSLACAMEALQARYRLMIGRCRLMLYARKDREGQRRGLYWGRLYKTYDGRKRIKHLPGRLKAAAIYWIALRWSDRAVFRDFDRRRLALNARRSRVSRALARAASSLSRTRVRAEHWPASEVAGDALLAAAWRVAWACASVEDAMVALVRRRAPVVEVSPVFPYATVGKHGYLAMGWAQAEKVRWNGRVQAGRRHVATRLTAAILAHAARELWPGLRAVDHRMRALRAEHERYARVIGRVRRLRRAA